MNTGRTHLTYLLAFLVMIGISSAPVSARTTIKDEISIGRKAAREIEKQYPVTEHKDWMAEMDRMGKMLIVNVKRKELPYTFKILKEDGSGGSHELDAFSLPGGPVYMSERMWKLLDRDERMGVLGHEITHVDRRHAIDTISEAQRRSVFATAVLIIAGAKGPWWDAADMGNQLYTLKFSRKREQEADMGGIDLCVAAKQTPAGLVTAMKKILEIEQASGGSPPKILATHPATKDRVAYMTKRVEQLGVRPEALTPVYHDLPGKVGGVAARGKDRKTITVSTTTPLYVNQAVVIRKPLWDDASNTTTQQIVAWGTVKTVGIKSEVSVRMESVYDFLDLEPGDGVYPAPVALPPKR